MNLLVVGMLYSCLITWSYGNSYVIYVGLSVLAMIIAYNNLGGLLFYHPTKIVYLCALLLLVSVIMGILSKNLMSCLQVNTSMVIPFAISCFNIDCDNIKKQMAKSAASLLAISVIMTSNVRLNSNSMAFLMYISGSFGFLWFLLEKNLGRKCYVVGYLLLITSLLLGTGSRNAGIVMMLCFVLLIIPKSIYKKPLFYRLLYIAAMLATVFAPSVMRFVFGNAKLMDILLQFTSSFSAKAWGMDTHLDVLLFVQNRANELNFVSKIFGEGIKRYHCHNLFYQCVFFYGYIGTIVLYGICGYIFESGFRLYRTEENKLTLGCCIIMIGHFLMQTGEVYMFGGETMLLGALIPMGIILQQVRTQHQRMASNSM